MQFYYRDSNNISINDSLEKKENYRFSDFKKKKVWITRAVKDRFTCD